MSHAEKKEINPCCPACTREIVRLRKKIATLEAALREWERLADAVEGKT